MYFESDFRTFYHKEGLLLYHKTHNIGTDVQKHLSCKSRKSKRVYFATLFLKKPFIINVFLKQLPKCTP